MKDLLHKEIKDDIKKYFGENEKIIHQNVLFDDILVPSNFKYNKTGKEVEILRMRIKENSFNSLIWIYSAPIKEKNKVYFSKDIHGSEKMSYEDIAKWFAHNLVNQPVIINK